MHIGNRIRKIRKSNKISMKKLASGIVSYTHLSNIEAGNYNAHEDILRLLAKRLNVSESYFINHQKSDQQLNSMLIEFKKKLDELNIGGAREDLRRIEQQYPYIDSVKQETYFYLLKTFFYISSNQKGEAASFFNDEVLPLMESIDPNTFVDSLRETYYYVRGVLHFHQNDFYLSNQYFLKIVDNINNDILKARVHYNTASSYLKLNELNNSLIHAKKAMEFYYLSHQWANLADTNNLIGILFMRMEDFKTSHLYFQTAIELTNKFDFPFLRAKVLHNIGLTYQRQGDLDKALDFFCKSLVLKKNDKKDVFITYRSILEIYTEQKQLNALKRVLEETKQYNTNLIEENHLKLFKAEIYLLEGMESDYEAIMKEIINFYIKNNITNYLVISAEKLSRYYEVKRKYKLALKYLHIAFETK